MRRQRSEEYNENGYKKQNITALIEVGMDGSFEMPLGIQNITEIQYKGERRKKLVVESTL